MLFRRKAIDSGISINRRTTEHLLFIIRKQKLPIPKSGVDGRSLSLSLKDGKQIPLFRFCIASQAPFRSRVSFWVPKGRVASASSRGWIQGEQFMGSFLQVFKLKKKQMAECERDAVAIARARKSPKTN